MQRYLLAVLAASVWINVSEFARNEVMIKRIWTRGFEEVGLTFPSSPVNGAVWGLWAIIFAAVLAYVTTRFGALKSALVCWVPGFVLLWVAMWNLGILPSGLLAWSIPWSFAEVCVAAYICRRILRDVSA